MSQDSSIRRTENVGTGFIVVATAFSALAVLVFHAIASRTLGPDGFAPIAVLWTLMFLLFTVLMLPAEQHLTRALVVTRDQAQIRGVYRAMAGSFALASVLGIGFVALTLTRFFEGNGWYVAITAVIMLSRSTLATARGQMAGHRRFGGYASTIAYESGAMIIGGLMLAILDAPAIGFALVMALAPFAALLARPFSNIEGTGQGPVVRAQPASFLVWLIVATASSQLIIAGGPIAVSFIGGTAAAVSIFFTSFALLRGPVTSAYNLVARVLPDFTRLAQSDNPRRLWVWAPRITVGGVVLAVLGAAGAAIALQTIIRTIYGEAFVPPVLAAALGGAGVGLGIGALFVTQVYSAAAKGAPLALGWIIALGVAIAVLVVSSLDPIDRVALAFVAGEGSGLLVLGVIFPALGIATRRGTSPRVE
ncbi:MAG: hypothetical protein ACR2N7_09970 [Acidimicrobiia bacterium]